MQQVTSFAAPSQEDYDNVTTLNRAFIAATTTLGGAQRDRLAATPFLLFSLREGDENWWRDVLQDKRQRDLIADAPIRDSELQRIQIAALGFLWQLVRRNAYAARIVSAANPAWCERIAAMPLITLYDRVADRSDLLESRIEHLGAVGERMSINGSSASHSLRRSTQIAALHSVLADAGIAEIQPLSAAACRLSGPLRQRSKKV